jgi:hypothetical protein
MSSAFDDMAKRMASAIMQKFTDESRECARRWIAEARVSPALPDGIKEMCITAYQTGYITAIRNHVIGSE